MQMPGKLMERVYMMPRLMVWLWSKVDFEKNPFHKSKFLDCALERGEKTKKMIFF